MPNVEDLKVNISMKNSRKFERKCKQVISAVSELQECISSSPDVKKLLASFLEF